MSFLSKIRKSVKSQKYVFGSALVAVTATALFSCAPISKQSLDPNPSEYRAKVTQNLENDSRQNLDYFNDLMNNVGKGNVKKDNLEKKLNPSQFSDNFAEEITYKTHIVKKGDWLSKIVTQYDGLTLEKLYELNPGLEDHKDNIEPGEEIKVKKVVKVNKSLEDKIVSNIDFSAFDGVMKYKVGDSNYNLRHFKMLSKEDYQLLSKREGFSAEKLGELLDIPIGTGKKGLKDYCIEDVKNNSSISYKEAIEFNRSMILKFTGEQYDKIKWSYSFKQLKEMFNMKSGIAVSNKDEIIDSLAVLHLNYMKFGNFKLDEKLLAAIRLTESGNPWAISSTRASGSAQLNSEMSVPTKNMALYKKGAVNPLIEGEAIKRKLEFTEHTDEMFKGKDGLIALSYIMGENKVKNLRDSTARIMNISLNSVTAKNILDNFNLKKEFENYWPKVKDNMLVVEKYWDQVIEVAEDMQSSEKKRGVLDPDYLLVENNQKERTNVIPTTSQILESSSKTAYGAGNPRLMEALKDLEEERREKNNSRKVDLYHSRKDKKNKKNKDEIIDGSNLEVVEDKSLKIEKYYQGFGKMPDRFKERLAKKEAQRKLARSRKKNQISKV